MKKILLVLVSVIGICLFANAQTQRCEIKPGTYMEVKAYLVDGGRLKCEARFKGERPYPKSGTAQVTVYYVDKSGYDNSETITLIYKRSNETGQMCNKEKPQCYWYGNNYNVHWIKDIKIKPYACDYDRY